MNNYLNSLIQGMGIGTGLAIISVILRKLFGVGIMG